MKFWISSSKMPRLSSIVLFTSFLIILYFLSFNDDLKSTARGWVNSASELKSSEISLSHLPPPMDDEYLAVCLIIKDQPLDLREFLIHHYYHMGIRRFYIMDDNSDPPIQEIEDFGIPESALTFKYYNTSEHVTRMQYKAYEDCINLYGHKHAWMAFIDTDEYIEMVEGNDQTLRDMLEELYPDPTVGALGINWKIHTSGGNLVRQKSTRKNFLDCIFDDEYEDNVAASSDNRHIKTIVKPALFDGFISPHRFQLKDGAETVGEHGDVVTTIAFRGITRDRIALHHYVVKSKEEYEEKIRKSNVMGDTKGWDFWDRIETGLPHVRCPEMARFRP